MAVDTVNLVVKVPEALRRRARAAAVLRGETISDVVRTALADYIARAESMPDNVRYTDRVLSRIAEGASTYSHEEVWPMIYSVAEEEMAVSNSDLVQRITIDPRIFGGTPIVRGRRLAVEHVLGMLAPGDTEQTLLEAYPWMEADDVRACLLYARKARPGGLTA